MKQYRSLTVSAKDIPAEQDAFTASWELLKKYYRITQTDDDAWRFLLQDYKQICHSHGRLGEHLAVGVLRYLEELSKQRREHEN